MKFRRAYVPSIIQIRTKLRNTFNKQTSLLTFNASASRKILYEQFPNRDTHANIDQTRPPSPRKKPSPELAFQFKAKNYPREGARSPAEIPSEQLPSDNPLRTPEVRGPERNANNSDPRNPTLQRRHRRFLSTGPVSQLEATGSSGSLRAATARAQRTKTSLAAESNPTPSVFRLPFLASIASVLCKLTPPPP